MAKEKPLLIFLTITAFWKKRSADAPGGPSNGYCNGGSGSYVKYLELEGEHVILDVDGAASCARVYLNENLMKFHPYGYTPFLTELTSKVRKGRLNRLEITTEHLQPSTRWYVGAGLYRDVYLWVGGSVRIEPRDIFITTPTLEEVKAVITVTSDLECTGVLKTRILSPNGELVAEQCLTAELFAGKNTLLLKYIIKDAQIWDVDTPNLYTFEAEIEGDSTSLNFGIRTVSADAKNGLLINGRSVKLKGGCIHHDHGGLGAASHYGAEYRKILKLKEAGFNAVRTAHNPPSRAFLEACDRLGMYVMDEAFDMWQTPKNPLDYSLWFDNYWQSDICDMVLRDRAHPSVISYSVGNEIPERGGLAHGNDLSRILSLEIRKYDNTRLVTGAVNHFWKRAPEDAPEEYKKDYLEGYDDIGGAEVGSSWDKRTEKFFEPYDIAGYNYLYNRYEHDHEAYPDRVMWGSETQALLFCHSWRLTERLPWVIGDFTWTAWDNIGEVGTGRWMWERDGELRGLAFAPYPWRCCYQGEFELSGFRRPQSYFRQAFWCESSELKIFATHPCHYGEKLTGTGWHWYDVQESWTFDSEFEGKPITVEAYTLADEVHFSVNGEVTVATQKDGIARADVIYKRGTVTAIAYKDGKEVARGSLSTVGKADRVEVTRDVEAGGLCYYNVVVVDKDGNRVPDANSRLTAEVEGGELLCIFSGDPANEDEYGTNVCHAFGGRAVAVVRTCGDVKLTVSFDEE